MNKKRLIIPIVITVFVAIVIIKSQNNVEEKGVSKYELYEPKHYASFGKGSELPAMLKTIEGDRIYVSGPKLHEKITFGFRDGTSYFLEGYKISDKLKAVLYFPEDNTIYSFGKNKPVNIIIEGTPDKNKNPYDSPLYIGYHDGTCEYPEEFNYVRSKSKCSQYLQDTLDYFGYDSVDEMLEDIFGDYITKDPDKSGVSN